MRDVSDPAATGGNGYGADSPFRSRLTLSRTSRCSVVDWARAADDPSCCCPQEVTPVSLEPPTDRSPSGFIQLEADAKADGHGHLTRLSAEFAKPLPRLEANIALLEEEENEGSEEAANSGGPTSAV
jgi:hypothetical protein